MRPQSRVMPRNGSVFAAIMRYISGAREAGTRWVTRGSSLMLPARHQVQRRLHPRPRPAGDEVCTVNSRCCNSAMSAHTVPGVKPQ